MLRQRSRTLFVLGLLAVAGASSCRAIDDGAPEDRAEAPAAETRPGETSRAEVAPPDAPEPVAWQRWTFDEDEVARPPGGFTPVHSGNGHTGEWQVVAAPDTPSGGRAVAQLDPDRTNYRFPLLVLDSVVARDVEIEVTGKPISGTKDQAIGLVWRYQDPDNYYVVRANALEDNVVLYKMEGGKRSDLDLEGRGRTYGLDVEVPRGSWSRLGVVARANRFTALLDGEELFVVEDDTFTTAGKVGLWTKADSVTWFDDLAVRVLDAPAETETRPEPGQ